MSTAASAIPPRLTRRGFSLGMALAAVAAPMPSWAQDVMGATGMTGAGSTFAYPLIGRWSREYRLWLARGGAFPAPNAALEDPPASSALDYEPVGSLAGTLRVKAGAVDFGASDVPIRSDELARLGLAQFPIVIGGIVAVVNIDGVDAGRLRLTGPVLADIFLGKITQWSDPAIAASNPGLKLPEVRINVVHRSDGSGTTFNFTDYLSKVSPAWKEKVGSDLLVVWPTGTGVKGNNGVAQAVRQSRNAIGYMEYAQAVQAKVGIATLQNRAGKFIKPEPASFQAAAAGADWGKTGDFQLMLTDVAEAEAYPVVATVFVLMRRNGAGRTRAALDFFQWSLESGGSHAAQLGYVPLPAALVKQVKAYWGTSFKAAG